MERKKQEILALLEKIYQGITTALAYRNPFELLIAVILSAQTTDKQVNRLTKRLFAKYPTPAEMAQLTVDELAEEIKGCGLYRNKAKNIAQTLRILLADYGGEVPAEREALLRLPGVGRKTANVVLSNAFNIPALAVDTHVFRVANRLGLADAPHPRGVEEQLKSLMPPEKWGDLHHWLIWHGRKVCRARNPQCPQCPFFELCPGRMKARPDQEEKE